MWKAIEFVDNFSKTVKLMKDNLPDGLMIYVSIYARDINEKSKDYPDWEIELRIIEKTSAFDRATKDRLEKETMFWNWDIQDDF